MANLWARKPIAMLEAEAEEREVQALVTHAGVPLRRTLSAVNLVALGIGATTVAIGWSGYVVSFLKDFGIVLPSRYAGSPFAYEPAAGWQATGAVINVPAMLVIAAISALLVTGVHESARVNNVIVVIKVS